MCCTISILILILILMIDCCSNDVDDGFIADRLGRVYSVSLSLTLILMTVLLFSSCGTSLELASP